MSESANKKRGRARKLPHWLRLYSGAFEKKKKKSKMSTTFSEKYKRQTRRSHTSSPKPRRCGVFSGIISLFCLTRAALTERLHGGCRDQHEAEGLPRLRPLRLHGGVGWPQVAFPARQTAEPDSHGFFLQVPVSPSDRRRFHVVIRSREIFIRR